MGTSEDFFPQAENMDLRELYDKVFVVGINSGPQDDGYMIVKSMHGPFTFEEMVGEVGRLWSEETMNSKVYVLEKDHKIKSKWLDSKTTDYIQAKYMDIIVAKLVFSENAEDFTCKATMLESLRTFI